MNEWRKEKLKNIVYINQNNFSKEDKWEYISYLDTANIQMELLKIYKS